MRDQSLIDTRTEAPANILLVDDMPQNLLSLSAVLDRPDYRIITCSSGADALRWVMREDFAVILLDVMMPEMNGFECAQLIKQRDRCREIPIVFLTAIANELSFTQHGYSVGAVDYLLKPLIPEVVQAKVAAFVEMYRKTEHHRRAEVKLRTANAQLQHSQSEWEAFTSAVCRELRGPLQQVAGLAALMRTGEGGTLDATAQGFAQRVEQTARHATGLLDALAGFADRRQQVPCLVPLDLGEIAREVVAACQAEAPERTVDWQIDTLPPVRGDAAQLRGVLQRLVDNALKFTRERDRPAIRIGAVQDASEVTVYVRDNGVGFPMQEAERLFHVFQRLHAHADFPGIGMGLAEVRSFVESHGGRTWAEGRVQAGATFYFALPRPAQEVRAAEIDAPRALC